MLVPRRVLLPLELIHPWKLTWQRTKTDISALNNCDFPWQGGHFQTHSEGLFQTHSAFRLHFYCQGHHFGPIFHCHVVFFRWSLWTQVKTVKSEALKHPHHNRYQLHKGPTLWTSVKNMEKLPRYTFGLPPTRDASHKWRFVWIPY